MYVPHRRFAPLPSCTLRHIPQAVSVVATHNDTQVIKRCVGVSIPQAVGIVATTIATKLAFISALRFQYRRR